MRKIIPLILACLLMLVLSGCASSENSIISIDLGDAVLTGDLVIDEAARTITATVLPIDISAITPVFEVSGNALIGEILLTDGAACSCTVTAEDGTAAEWTVTVTVAPGISFKYNGTSKSFLNGVIDSSDSDVNVQYGDGIPYLSACTTPFKAAIPELRINVRSAPEYVLQNYMKCKSALFHILKFPHGAFPVGLGGRAFQDIPVMI